MAGYMKSSNLIDAVKRQAAIPVNQQTFSNDDILAMASQELVIGILPSILNVHEEYYVYKQDYTLAANQSAYPVPYRAVGQKLRQLYYIDAANNYIHLSRISPDDKDIYQQSYSGAFNYLYFYMEGNNFVLAPGVRGNPVGSIEASFYMRPSDLVMDNEVATIQSISVDPTAGTTTFSMDQVPSTFTTATLLDICQTRPGHKIIDWDLTAASVSIKNASIVFNTTDVDPNIMVGDYVALAGESIIPQCPPELHPVLVQRVVARILDALGDAQGLNNTNVKLQEMEQKTFAIIDNRTEGNPQKIVNNRGLLRASKMRRRFWY